MESGFSRAGLADYVDVGKAVFGVDVERLLDASEVGFFNEVCSFIHTIMITGCILVWKAGVFQQ